MAEELLSLKWNNHQAHFVDILTLLREKDMFIDATIACGGKVYSAHKFVLSTCSDYFKQIFTRSPTSNPIVFMKDVSCRDIEALLDFMYNGEVSVPQSSLGSLIKTAEGLQIKGLAVPDDPPSSRRQQERDKRERDPSLSFPENRSPPPKRRVREKNTPPRRLSNHQQSRPSNSTIDSSSLENNLQINNDLSDNNSSGLVRNNSPGAGPESSAPSDNNTSKKQHNNVNANSRKHSIAEEEGDEDRGGGGGEDSNHDEDSADNGSLQQPQDDGDIGTAAVTHSKHEEMEIKQEDVVDLGEDDEGGEWGDGGGMGDGGADDGGVGGNDSLSSADNTVNFSDVLLAHSEGGAMAGGSGAAGDSAMTRQTTAVRVPRQKENNNLLLLPPGLSSTILTATRLGEQQQPTVADRSAAYSTTPLRNVSEESRCASLVSGFRYLNSGPLDSRRQVAVLQPTGVTVSYGTVLGEAARPSVSSGYTSQGVGSVYDSTSRSEGALVREPTALCSLVDDCASLFGGDGAHQAASPSQETSGREATSGRIINQDYNAMPREEVKPENYNRYHAPCSSAIGPAKAESDTTNMESKVPNTITLTDLVFYHNEQLPQQHEQLPQQSPPFQAFLNLKQEITVDEHTLNAAGESVHSPLMDDSCVGNVYSSTDDSILLSQVSGAMCDLDASSSSTATSSHQRQLALQHDKQHPPHHPPHYQYHRDYVPMPVPPVAQESPRPHSCRFCMKRFKRKDHVVEHERTHTGERPYVCVHCGKSFAKKSNLNTHLRTHFPGTPSQEPDNERLPE